jgi:subtilase family serine protease
VTLSGTGIVVIPEEKPLPDLKISQVNVLPDTNALPGEELTVLATVLNLGQADAGPFRLGVYLSDDDLITAEVDEEMGSCEFEGLAAGGLESEEGNVCKLTLTLPEDLRLHTSVYIGAIADDELAVKESNEGNNSDYVEVRIEGEGNCEGVFQATLQECLEAGASSPLGCVRQALAAQKECESGL